MEKFALLNLLKAIDGLQGAKSAGAREPSSSPAANAPSPNERSSADGKYINDGSNSGDGNLLYSTLMRHEEISNRLRRKK